SGKSTLLRSLVVSLALSQTPHEAQFYCLDFGGGSLTGLRDLPHVGGVATRLDAGEVRRTVAEGSQLLAERERLFADNNVDSIATYRRLKKAGLPPEAGRPSAAPHPSQPRATSRFAEDPFGDVFLVVDGWATIRADFEDLEPVVADIANRGLSY